MNTNADTDNTTSTTNAAAARAVPPEVSEMKRRASLARRHFRGGPHPKPDDKKVHPRCASLCAEDLAVFQRLASRRGITLRRLFSLLACLLVHGSGGAVPAHPDLADEGWTRHARAAGILE